MLSPFFISPNLSKSVSPQHVRLMKIRLQSLQSKNSDMEDRLYQEKAQGKCFVTRNSVFY